MHTLKRTVLVTGASSGIGHAIAQYLLRQGQTVIGVSRDSGKFTRPMANFRADQVDLSRLHDLPLKSVNGSKLSHKSMPWYFSQGWASPVQWKSFPIHKSMP